MKTFLTGILLILIGILIAGVIASPPPPRGTNYPPPRPLPFRLSWMLKAPCPALAQSKFPPPATCRMPWKPPGGRCPTLTSLLNLAAPLVDGTQILVPGHTQPTRPTTANPASQTLINLNTACGRTRYISQASARPAASVLSITEPNLGLLRPWKT